MGLFETQNICPIIFRMSFLLTGSKADRFFLTVQLHPVSIRDGHFSFISDRRNYFNACCIGSPCYYRFVCMYFSPVAVTVWCGTFHWDVSTADDRNISQQNAVSMTESGTPRSAAPRRGYTVCRGCYRKIKLHTAWKGVKKWPKKGSKISDSVLKIFSGKRIKSKYKPGNKKNP